MLQTVIFYVFACITLASAVMVVSVRNPVHAVLALILAFFNAAGLFVLLGAEFVAMILVIVYVGAVAVLFLFVVMMLDIDFAMLRQGVRKALPLGILVGLVLVAELVLAAIGWQLPPAALSPAMPPVVAGATEVSNTQAIGAVLYTHYALLFQASGLVLLVAMIGAIVLTLRHRPDVRRQKIGDQHVRTRAQSVALRKVSVGEGVQ